MVTLQRVDVPGYGEAVRKEQAIRDAAWRNGNEVICGVVVRPLCLETILLLEGAQNGFAVRRKFTGWSDAAAHAFQVLFFSRPEFRAPAGPQQSKASVWLAAFHRHRFIRMVLGRYSQVDVIDEVKEWMDDAFMDAPSGDSEGINSASHASYPAYLIDLFAEAGMMYSHDDILKMPLKRLWQLVRVAGKRCRGIPLTNPSDEVFWQGFPKENN